MSENDGILDPGFFCPQRSFHFWDAPQGVFYFYLCLFVFFASCALLSSGEEASYVISSQELAQKERVLKRIEAHTVIHDYPSAYNEAKQALTLYPQVAEVHVAYIRSTAKLGKEKEVLQAWKNYQKQFPNLELNRALLEEMAWGVLQKASSSSSLATRQLTLLAAFFSQQMHGVNILAEGMCDSNYSVRAIAVMLAGHLRDSKLIKEIQRLLKEEKMWLVRKEIISAIGSMKIYTLRPELEGIIASDSTLVEEKTLAIESLLTLLDQAERLEMVRLSSSNRAGLRLLAAEAIGHFISARDLDLLYRLCQDPHAEVRASAFRSIGLIRPDSQPALLALARKGGEDPYYKVAISAAWLLALYQPTEGQQILKRHLEGGRKEVRYYAAAALRAAGPYGIHLSADQFKTHVDPYVRLNLAIGLAGQQIRLNEVSLVLEELLLNQKERWKSQNGEHFNYISADPSATEMENQLVRLNVLNILAILKSLHAQEAARKFLQERQWGISATASILLLTEGDDSALELVQQLLEDPQAKVRIQAALILSLWSRSESAIQVLEEGYVSSDNDLKGRILEGIGRIGSMHSVPFLVKALEEPSQTLRLIAAMALIQCLNH